jgi:uncharacterized lipoprotein YddW (UPF0748 family)
MGRQEGRQTGNFGDPGFRKWTDFRIQTITDFLREIDVNVKKVNPKCKTIAEISRLSRAASLRGC